MIAKVGVYQSQNVNIVLQNQQLQLTPTGLKINTHFIKYENVTTIGSDATSVLLCLKNDGQEDEDDGDKGKQVVENLTKQVNGIEIKGGLNIQIWIEQKQQFIDQFKQLQKNCLKEAPQQDLWSSDEEDEGDEDEFNQVAMDLEKD